ncbi:hypothetical protein Cgig2_033470 [Carnegiea gigantea]|uniref:Aminotransferase-like plant mobile domain-containing protein n=1 Tax=Carnegiea gigantea TaxID=171969 RepID=A0A9Q1GS47_9CARY|nr:hypothetical protein Cgig2_033470 [Carnegiea gigantea]
MKSDCQSRVPLPTNVSLITKVYGWNESHAVFGKLGMPKGKHTETFLVAFLSYWLCLFILLVKDTSYIYLGTFSVASSIERGQAYCLSSAILTIIYRGLSEICHSAHPGGKGGHIPWNFLYAWMTKYFRTYDFDDNVSSNLRMLKFSGFGRAKTFDLDGARELISSGLLEFHYKHHYPHRFSRQFGFYQDIPTDIVFSILPSSKIMLRLHQACIHYGANSRVLVSGQCPSLEREFTRRFQEWRSKVFLISSSTYSGGNSKKKRDSSSKQNIQRDEGPSGSKPKLKLIRSQKPLRYPVLKTEDNTI